MGIPAVGYARCKRIVLVAWSLRCNECIYAILYGRSGNSIAVLAEEAEMSTCWADIASDFHGKCSSLLRISLGSSFVNTWCLLFILLSRTKPTILNLSTA
jgi:hypothetical protein